MVVVVVVQAGVSAVGVGLLADWGLYGNFSVMQRQDGEEKLEIKWK